MRTVIKAENLSKKFRIGRFRRDEGTLRDLVGNIIKYPFSKQRTQNLTALWALRDVSFEVKQGETFGVIGGNGAGKSTLLKILSRIIKPTGGRAKLDGRVGSLLEIGTGFHQDLTGRENIFLNGAILGMSRREVEKKFDEIVAFADLEKFLGTPVKFYSSGMYARLAFAVAAHLEPEILIVDEVLSVGDAAFQAKCLGKMGKVAEGGRTVLFVSHSAAMVEKLCRTGLYLEKGRVKAFGEMGDVMAQYKADYEKLLGAGDIERKISDVKAGEARFIDWKLLNSDKPQTVFTGDEGVFEITFVNNKPTARMNLKFIISDLEERIILASENTAEIKEGVNKLQWICNLPLKPDKYKISAEAYFDKEYAAADRWNFRYELTVLARDGMLPQVSGIVNVPTKFHVVQN